MSPDTSDHPRRPHWRRDAVELAALFTAVAVADTVAHLIGHGPDGPELLAVSAVVLLATAAFHAWWAHRHRRPARPPRTAGRPGGPGAPPADAPTTGVWRLRTTVRDAPGSLAALCTALASHGVDILSLQTHPLAEGTVDEFLLRVPAGLSPTEVTRAADRAGGTDHWIERADAHDLVDAPTRVLALATRTALDPAELPPALRRLLGRCTVRPHPAPVDDDEGVHGTVLRLRTRDGGLLTVERPHLPFTPTEFARARALVELDGRLGPRVPEERSVLELGSGAAVTVRRASPADLAAATALHERCSPRTLRQRYHGSSRDTDRRLPHLLHPAYGRTLAVCTASGRIVALGHLLWDGDETEVALLVEDAWQGRGIGGELLGRLVRLAEEAGCRDVHAVTGPSNTAMIAALRGLGRPLDYLADDGVLVVTAALGGPEADRSARGGSAQQETPSSSSSADSVPTRNAPGSNVSRKSTGAPDSSFS
ncbi:GNAT family N-acetyltransferase [Streptomyces sp. NPDC002454]